jgi:hypothetical protein
MRADDVVAEVSQSARNGSLRIPGDETPDELVDVIIDAFGVDDETDSSLQLPTQDGSSASGPS